MTRDLIAQRFGLGDDHLLDKGPILLEISRENIRVESHQLLSEISRIGGISSLHPQ
jgi:hypothetical protein